MEVELPGYMHLGSRSSAADSDHKQNKTNESAWGGATDAGFASGDTPGRLPFLVCQIRRSPSVTGLKGSKLSSIISLKGTAWRSCGSYRHAWHVCDAPVGWDDGRFCYEIKQVHFIYIKRVVAKACTFLWHERQQGQQDSEPRVLEIPVWTFFPTILPSITFIICIETLGYLLVNQQHFGFAVLCFQ